MRSHSVASWLCGFLLLALGQAQSIPSTPESSQTISSTESTASQSSPATSSTGDPGTSSPGTTTTTRASPGDSTTTSSGSSSSSTTPPDVYLNVPELHVGKIELDVDDLNAELTLAAQIASLVEINAGVQVGISKVNITIAEVDAELELIVRLGNLVEIVNRTLTTLNLNPLLINVISEVTDLVDAVVGAVDGLLGSIVNGDSTINFIIDNLGNIVQEVAGGAGQALSSIVGNYEQNMTYTGAQEILDGGFIQKTYSYSPLNALVNIVFNSLGQVVQAVVVKRDGSGGGTSTTSATAARRTVAARK
ncbi:hypothetical protein F5B22DRAFT_592516 [Xylaria bambusicola]|uniref:uncharacterized protein n=1 Tax=Xylaria bambusicola TaxID=326684 RepID=UPI0020079124|nr:uncharacterized protein F5B22DRAFT_592516 [Xylaria bambusicola]KAI0523925.1 hypothetical protein F5B22DRAFT_592516 [Xylaria bambusicola]